MWADEATLAVVLGDLLLSMCFLQGRHTDASLMNFLGFGPSTTGSDTIVIVGKTPGAQEASKNSTARMSTDVLTFKFVISSAAGL